MADIMKTVISESVERLVRKQVEKTDLVSLGKTEGGHGIALKVLSFLDAHVPKAFYPIAGTVVAAFLAKPGILDRLLPDNSFAGVREAKMILQNFVPPAIIGASESFADAMRKSIDGVRSDNRTAESDQNKPLDWVVMSPKLPGRILIPARDDNGRFRFYANDPTVHVVLDRDWRIAKEHWDETHKATTKREKQGKQTVTTPVPREAFPFTLLKLSEAIAQMDEKDIRAGDIDSLKKLLSKPEWYDKLDGAAKDLMHAMSVTASRLSAIQKAITEDFLKDLPNKASPSQMNDLGTRYANKIQSDGSLLKSDFDVIITHADIWMGAGLEGWTRIKYMGSKAYSAYKNGSLPFGAAAKMFFVGMGLTAPIWIMLAGALLAFVTSAYLFIWAASADAGQAFMGMADGQSMATSVALVSAWTLMILLTFLSVIELSLSPLTNFFGWEKGWLKDIGLKIGALIGCYGFLAILMLHYGVSAHFRFFLPLTALGAMGTAYTIALGERTYGENGRLARQAGKVFKWIVTAVFIYMILGSLWQVLGALVVEWVKEAYQFIKAHSVLAFVVMLLVAAIPAALALRWIETKDTYENGQWSRVHETSWSARLIALVIILALTGWVFVDPPNQRYQWFHTPTADEIAQKEAANAKARAEAAAATLQWQQTPQTVVSEREVQTRRERSHKRRARQDDRVEADCDSLPYEAKVTLGCPL